MTLQPLLKVIDKNACIRIVDSGLPISRNTLFLGQRKDIKKFISKETYLSFRDKHISGIYSCNDVICIIADVTKEKRSDTE